MQQALVVKIWSKCFENVKRQFGLVMFKYAAPSTIIGVPGKAE